jgi:pyruvate-formate lyase
VRYYPAGTFATSGLRNGSSYIQFGGEIVDNRPSGRHTGTDMGSGAFPTAGAGAAAYQRNLSFYGGLSAPTLSDVNGGFKVTGSTCYNITTNNSGSWRRNILFGGPGYDVNNCL